MTQPMTAERLAEIRDSVKSERLLAAGRAWAVYVRELLAHIDHLTEEHETYRRDAGETWRACLEAAGVDFSDLEIAQAECDCYGPKPSDTIRGKVNELRSEVSRLAAENERLREENAGYISSYDDWAEVQAEQAATIERLRAALQDAREWGAGRATAADKMTIACGDFENRLAAAVATIERLRSVLSSFVQVISKAEDTTAGEIESLMAAAARELEGT